jgi:phosphotransferase system HPr-like phosphotransfer protein
MNNNQFDLDPIELMYNSGLHAVVENIFKLIQLEIKKGNTIKVFRKSSDYETTINNLEELIPIYNAILRR